MAESHLANGCRVCDMWWAFVAMASMTFPLYMPQTWALLSASQRPLSWPPSSPPALQPKVKLMRYSKKLHQLHLTRVAANSGCPKHNCQLHVCGIRCSSQLLQTSCACSAVESWCLSRVAVWSRGWHLTQPSVTISCTLPLALAARCPLP